MQCALPCFIRHFSNLPLCCFCCCLGHMWDGEAREQSCVLVNFVYYHPTNSAGASVACCGAAITMCWKCPSSAARPET